MKTPRYIVFSVVLLLSCSLVAQTRQNPNAIGVFGVKTEYIGDLGNNVFRFGNDFRGGIGLSLDRYINRFFDFGFYASWSSTGLDRGITTYVYFEDWDNRSQLDNEVKNFHVDRLTNFHIQGRFKILNDAQFRLIPFVGLSAGMAFYQGIGTNYLDGVGNLQTMSFFNFTEGFVPTNSARIVNLEQRSIGTAATLGGVVGLQFRLSRYFGIRYQATGSWTSRDDFDFYVSGGNDFQLQHHIGLTFSFSGRRPPAAAPPRKPFRAQRKQKPVFPTSTLSSVEFAESLREAEKPSVEAESFVFPSILLPFGRAEIGCTEVQSRLDSIAGWLLANPNYGITISGHADSTGPKIYNQILSKNRATTIKRSLVKKGVDPNRITVRAYGDTKPIADNNTREGRAKNRRVEIKVSRLSQ